MTDEVLSASARTTQLHSDSAGQWMVIDDGPAFGQVLAVPASWDHRQLLSRHEAAARFDSLDLVPAELDAIRRAFEALEPLAEDARERAMQWLVNRFGFTSPEPVREIVIPSPAGQVDARRRRVQELWRGGATYKEIAAELGITAAAAGAMIHHMRDAGWDLPYRPRGPRASREER